jgi:signal transduction histidine kinase
MTALGAAGWVVAGAAGVRSARARRRDERMAGRLEAIGDAEHELRGALTAFGLALDRLGNDPLGRRIGRALASELDRARLALEQLGDAREGERHPPRREPLALDRLARSAAAAWQPAARSAGRRVQVDWRAGPVRVRGDRGRLAQALGNLLANAVEHGSGPVRLEATRHGRSVRLEVVNGLREEEEAVGTGRPRGRGLRIASQAIDACGGTLSFSRTGGRAAAALELPLAS